MILMLIILLACVALLIVGIALVLIAGLPIWLIIGKTMLDFYIGYVVFKKIKERKERS